MNNDKTDCNNNKDNRIGDNLQAKIENKTADIRMEIEEDKDNRESKWKKEEKSEGKEKEESEKEKTSENKERRKETKRNEVKKEHKKVEYEEANEIISKVHKNRMNVRIMVWNMQSLNENITERMKKIRFLNKMVTEVGPELVFIIDAGKNVSKIILPNYTLVNNGRDMIGKSQWVKEDIENNRGCFVLEDLEILFGYIRPNEKDKEKVELVKEKVEQGWKVIGDMNLMTNKELAEVFTRNGGVDGEETIQTVITKDVIENRNIVTTSAPSDHKMIIFEINKVIKNSAKMRLKTLNIEETEKVIGKIIKEGVMDNDVRVIQVKNRTSESEEEYKKECLLRAYLNAKMDIPYRYYNFLWKGDKKEPFLGTTIPKKVEEDLRNHYREDENKEYKRIKISEEEVKEIYRELIPKKQTFSSAQNFECMSLEKVDKALIEIWEGLSEEEKIKAVGNIVKVADERRKSILFKAFFLAKNKELNSVNDIRIIVIPPTIIKIWENLIYSKVVEEITKIIDDGGVYQHGAKPGSSTYVAAFNLKKKSWQMKSKAIAFIDIAKGFDNIDFERLGEMINKMENKKVRIMLKVWLTMVRNSDVTVNGGRIKKGRGLAMGLALSPIIFAFYCNEPLEKIKKVVKKEKITMYVDDMALNLSQDPLKAVEEYKTLEEMFKEYNLPFNRKKCVLLSEDEEISKEFLNRFGIKTESKEKYLGVTLMLKEGGELESDNRFYEIKGKMLSLPKFHYFPIKKLIFKGALFAKIRFRMMMIRIQKKLEKTQIMKIIRSAHLKDFQILSFIELVQFGPNVAQILIDLEALEELKKKVQNIEDEEMRIKIINQELKKIMETGVVQLDSRLKELNCNLDLKDVEINLDTVKTVVNKVWKTYKKEVMKNWRQEKGNEGIYPEKIDKWIDNKLVMNVKSLINIVFRHLDLTKKNNIGVIREVMKQIAEQIKVKDKKIRIKTENKKYFMINVPKEVLKEENDTKEKIYKELDSYLDVILQETKKDKVKYREIMWILINMDVILESKNWNTETISTMLEMLNYRIEDQNKEREVIHKIIEEEEKEQESEFEIITEEQEGKLENTMKVNGYEENGRIISVIKIMKKIQGKQKEIKYKMEIQKEDGLNNTMINMIAILVGLKKLREMKWRKVNVIINNMEIVKYVNLEWNIKNRRMWKIVGWLRTMMKERDIKVKWWLDSKNKPKKEQKVEKEEEKDESKALTEENIKKDSQWYFLERFVWDWVNP